MTSLGGIVNESQGDILVKIELLHSTESVDEINLAISSNCTFIQECIPFACVESALMHVIQLLPNDAVLLMHRLFKRKKSHLAKFIINRQLKTLLDLPNRNTVVKGLIYDKEEADFAEVALQVN